MEQIRNQLTTDLYKQYLTVMMDKLEAEPRPPDILRLSSETICGLIDDAVDGDLPGWCQPVSWDQYAGRRYERPARRLAALLAPENYRNAVGDGEQGWTVRSETVIVWDRADAFGRTSIKGEIPDFLYDDTSSVGDTFVLWRKQTEEFLGTGIKAPGLQVALESVGPGRSARVGDLAMDTHRGPRNRSLRLPDIGRGQGNKERFVSHPPAQRCFSGGSP